jgi:hypothetical protein
MARGWESKSVESQIEGAAAAAPAKEKLRPLSELGQQRARKRQELDLARKRVLGDLAGARHPRHRELLERTLADLETRIAALGPES